MIQLIMWMSCRAGDSRGACVITAGRTMYPLCFPARRAMLLSAPVTCSSGAPILAAGGAALGADVGGETIAPLAGRRRLKHAASSSAASSSVGARDSKLRWA